MKKRYVLPLICALLALLAGAVLIISRVDSNRLDEISSTNARKVSKVTIGMEERQMLAIMGAYEDAIQHKQDTVTYYYPYINNEGDYTSIRIGIDEHKRVYFTYDPSQKQPYTPVDADPLLQRK